MSSRSVVVLFLCPPSVPLHSVYQVLCHSYNCQVSVCCSCRQGLHLHFSCQVLNRSSHLLSVPSFQRLARCSVYLTSTSLRLSKNVAGPLGSSGVCVCVCSEVARPRALSGKKIQMYFSGKAGNCNRVSSTAVTLKTTKTVPPESARRTYLFTSAIDTASNVSPSKGCWAEGRDVLSECTEKYRPFHRLPHWIQE